MQRQRDVNQVALLVVMLAGQTPNDLTMSNEDVGSVNDDIGTTLQCGRQFCDEKPFDKLFIKPCGLIAEHSQANLVFAKTSPALLFKALHQSTFARGRHTNEKSYRGRRAKGLKGASDKLSRHSRPALSCEETHRALRAPSVSFGRAHRRLVRQQDVEATADDGNENQPGQARTLFAAASLASRDHRRSSDQQDDAEQNQEAGIAAGRAAPAAGRAAAVAAGLTGAALGRLLDGESDDGDEDENEGGEDEEFHDVPWL
ncbi:hypothetical protein BH11CYA1_BH11CYA1_07350 [soil metagenome]